MLPKVLFLVYFGLDMNHSLAFHIFKKYRFVQSFKIVILFYYNSTCKPCDVAFITLHNCVLTQVMSSDCMFLLYLYFQACIQVLLVGR